MSDPFNQIRRCTALSYPDFVKPQLNDSTKMFCNLKTSNETAIMIEVFRGLQKQPPEVFYKKGVLRNFAKFTEKHLCQRLFLNKVGGLISIPPENVRNPLVF